MSAGPRTPGVEVELQIACRARGIPAAGEIERMLEDTLRQAGRPGGRFGMVVRIVDERESRALNYRFRQQDRPTNVLSFPADAEFAADPEAEGRLFLGDLAVCAPVLEREAAAQGKRPADHWAHLLVHGTLHLLGFDHQTDDEAAAMEGLERRILAARGIADPYA
jgi:probable rRNA maturation factor